MSYFVQLLNKKIQRRNILKKTILFSICLILFFNANSTYAANKKVPLGEYMSAEKAVPVLVYHLVSNNLFSSNTDLFVKPEEFEKQMELISKNGYTPIFADELSQAGNYKKPIIITFDDGYIDNYENVFPIIKKYNIKITIFVITGMVNEKNHLTAEQISEMSDSGLVSIQSHTVTHRYMTKLDNSELITELEKSKEEIYKLTNKYPTAIAYPYGDINNETIEQVKKYYSLGFSTSKGTLSNAENKYSITRYGVSRSTELKDIQHYIDSIYSSVDILHKIQEDLELLFG